MSKIFALSVVLGLPLACGGTSEHVASGGSAGQGGHESGRAGATGGGAGKAHAGAGTGGGAAGAGGASGGAGHAGSMGAGAGTGGLGASGAGTGAGAGSGGRDGVGMSGNAGKGGAGQGGGGAGQAGEAGAAGNDGKVCGGISGAVCDLGQYCKYDAGTCGGASDATGTCTTQPGGIACVLGYVCGCDGKVYANLCAAHASGVDTWSGNQCVPGDGSAGDACLTDDDCSSGLKCCSSPIQVISCSTPMGSGCPLTP
jgi:hypothetical protein